MAVVVRGLQGILNRAALFNRVEVIGTAPTDLWATKARVKRHLP